MPRLHVRSRLLELGVYQCKREFSGPDCEGRCFNHLVASLHFLYSFVSASSVIYTNTAKSVKFFSNTFIVKKKSEMFASLGEASLTVCKTNYQFIVLRYFILSFSLFSDF